MDPHTRRTYRQARLAASLPRPEDRVSLLFRWSEQGADGQARECVRAASLGPGEFLVVGRSEPSTLVIDEQSLSRTHARFTLTGTRLHLQDLASTNGSTLNGVRCAEGDLSVTDEVSLGGVRVVVVGASRPWPIEGARLGSYSLLAERLAQELERGQVYDRPLALVGLRVVSPGGRTDEPGWWRPALPALRSLDTPCLYTPDLLLVLLPELEDRQAEQAVQSLDAQLPGVSLATGLACCPGAAASAEALVQGLVAAVRGASAGQRVRVGAEARRPDFGPGEAVILSEPTRRLDATVGRVAPTDMPVLVLGETGSGKERVAHALHASSRRASGPLRVLNCATIPASLIESVLFGHERGAFSGADRRRPGLFEQADGGTVFLDEVGELSPSAQAALLRVLETGKVTRVGGEQELSLDVRVVAATHRDLAVMVARGEFREDLRYRLDALSLQVPPLRARVEEIVPLAELFLRGAREKWNCRAREIPPPVRAVLCGYRWPGNVRQLRNAIERAAVLCSGATLALDDLPDEVLAASGMAPAPPVGGAPGAHGEDAAPEAPGAAPADGDPPFNARVRAFEIALLREALEACGGNQTRAAERLGLPRRTLANKVHAYGLKDPSGD